MAHESGRIGKMLYAKIKCGICGKWFCRDCGRTVPEGHGFGTICKNCYNQIKREDSRKK